MLSVSNKAFIDLLAGNPEWNLPLSCSKATLQTRCTEQSNTFKSQTTTKAYIVPGEPLVALNLLRVGGVYKNVTYFISQVACCTELSTIHQK